MPVIVIYGIIAAVIFSAGAGLGSYLTANSYKADMLDASNEKIEQQNIIAVEVAESVKRVQEFRDEQEKNLVEVINEREKSLADLHKRERAAVAANRGLFVSAATCSGKNGVSAETGSTSIVSSGADRVRLSFTDEHDIRSAFGDAQRVVIQYNACREKLKSLVTVAE